MEIHGTRWKKQGKMVKVVKLWKSMENLGSAWESMVKMPKSWNCVQCILKREEGPVCRTFTPEPTASTAVKLFRRGLKN